MVRFVCGFSRSDADEHLNRLKVAEILGVFVVAAAACMSIHIGGIVVDMRKRLGHRFIAAQVGSHGRERERQSGESTILVIHAIDRICPQSECKWVMTYHLEEADCAPAHIPSSYLRCGLDEQIRLGDQFCKHQDSGNREKKV